MKDPETDPRPYGPHEYDCPNCGWICAGPSPDDLCLVCQLFGPEAGKAIGDWANGEITGEDVAGILTGPGQPYCGPRGTGMPDTGGTLPMVRKS